MYGQEVDLNGAQSKSLEEIRSWIMELEKIQKEVMHVSVPHAYAGELYSLRIHIAHVQESLKKTEAILRVGGNDVPGKAKD